MQRMGLMTFEFQLPTAGAWKWPLPIERPRMIKSFVFKAANSAALGGVFWLSEGLNRITVWPALVRRVYQPSSAKTAPPSAENPAGLLSVTHTMLAACEGPDPTSMAPAARDSAAIRVLRRRVKGRR